MNGVSIFTACKDRNDNLLKVISSWIECEHINEIIIVDWSSKIKVVDTLKNYLTSYNIKIIEVTKDCKWILSWAFNLSACFTNYNKILKLDCDYKINKDFINKHSLLPGTFYSGDWRSARNDNEKYLNGCVYLYRDDFFKINGYNEYIQTYGWDDTDLYNRLQKNNIKQISINNDYIIHLEHETKCRQSDNTFKDIHYNRFLVNNIKWDIDISMNSYLYNTTFALLNKEKYSYIVVHDIISTINITDDIKLKTQNDLDNYLDILKKMKNENKDDINKKLIQDKNNIINQFETDKKLLELRKLKEEIKRQEDEEELHRQTKLKLKILEEEMKLKLNISDNNKFYINVHNGMGNKLRALASAHTLYEYLLTNKLYNKYDWKLIIIWSPDEHCLAEIQDLFEIESICKNYPNKITVINKVPIDLPKDTIRLYDIVTQNDEKDNLANNKINDFLKKIEISDKPVTIYLESACVLSFPCNNWNSDCKYLQNLKYSVHVNELLIKINNELETHNIKLHDLIGLHIRIGQDDQNFDDISGWSLTKQEQWKHWRKHSNYDRFVTAIKNELAKNCKGFYLASDTKWVYDKLTDEFPGKIFYLKRYVWDRSKNQVITGLVDVIALTKTKKLLGSNWSSFSELCKRLNNNIPMELAGINF